MKKTITLNEKDPVQREAGRIITNKYGKYFSKHVAAAIVAYEKNRGVGSRFEEQVKEVVEKMIPQICWKVEMEILSSIVGKLHGQFSVTDAEPVKSEDKNAANVVSSIGVGDIDMSDFDPAELDGF